MLNFILHHYLKNFCNLDTNLYCVKIFYFFINLNKICDKTIKMGNSGKIIKEDFNHLKISEDDIVYLLKKTHFCRNELLVFHAGFVVCFFIF
jgi:hypothetical protein